MEIFVNKLMSISQEPNESLREETTEEVIDQINSPLFPAIVTTLFASNSYPDNIKIVVASLMVRWIKENIKALQFERIEEFCSLIVRLVMESSSSVESKETLCDCLKVILLRASQPTLEHNMREMIMTSVFRVLGQGSPGKRQVLGCIMIVWYMVRTLMNMVTYNGFFEAHKAQLEALGVTLMEGLVPEILKSDVSQLDHRSEVVQSLTILRLYFEMVHTLVERMIDTKCSRSIAYVLTDPKSFLALSSKMLGVSLSRDSSNIFSTTGVHTVDTEANQLKAAIIESWTILLYFFIKRESAASATKQRDQPFLKEYPQYQGAIQVMQLLIDHVYQIYKQPGFSPRLLEMETMSPLREALIATFRLFYKTCGWVDFYEVYRTAFPVLIREVLLRNLGVTDQEIGWLEEDEVEFVKYSFDLIGDQKSQTLKSYSLGVLERLCSKIDGALSFLHSLLFPAFQALLANTNSPYLPFAPLHALDVILLVYADLHHLLLHRDDLRVPLLQLLDTHLEALVNQDSLIACRVFLLTSTYFGSMMSLPAEYLPLTQPHEARPLYPSDTAVAVLPGREERQEAPCGGVPGDQRPEDPCEQRLPHPRLPHGSAAYLHRTDRHQQLRNALRHSQLRPLVGPSYAERSTSR